MKYLHGSNGVLRELNNRLQLGERAKMKAKNEVLTEVKLSEHSTESSELHSDMLKAW